LQVQYILDGVLLALEANPDRKFVYVEQAFYQRWWNEASASEQSRMVALFKRGQLDFVNGGWCMHDEAAAHYVDMIDQTTLGHRFLKQQFGAVPTVGWQIDPFGHSATQAALLSAEVGFDSLWFMRIDYGDREARLQRKAMQFMWRPSASLPTAQVCMLVSLAVVIATRV
jgi:alpha-mannosidase